MTNLSKLGRLLCAAAMAAAPLMAGPVLAHGSTQPKHGGQVVMSGETLVEIVRAPSGVAVYVTDEDEPLAASGYNGKLIVAEGAKKREAMLKSAAGNRFDAPGLKIANGAKVTVSLVNKASSARTMASFTVK